MDNVLDHTADHDEDNWPTVPTTELIERCYSHPSTAQVIEYHGIYRYNGNTGTVDHDFDPDTAPSGTDFDFVHLSDCIHPSLVERKLTELAEGAHDSTTSALYLVIPRTGWSDYSGSVLERSNYNALHKDFDTAFVNVSGDYGYSALAVRLDGTRVTELLADTLGDLSFDSPLYDSEAMSDLERELGTEGWTSHGLWDFTRALEKRLTETVWWNDDTDPESWTWWPTDDEITAWFWDFDARGRDNDPYEVETAVSVHFGTIDADVDRIILDIVSHALKRERLSGVTATETDETPSP